jgi:hypothetical protein
MATLSDFKKPKNVDTKNNFKNIGNQRGFIKEFDEDKNLALQTLSNIIPSAKQLGSDIAQPFMHPIQTAKSIGDLGSSIVNLIKPGEQGNEQLARDVGTFFADRYGGLENLKKTMATDPMGLLSDVSIVLTGGATLVPKLAGTTGKIGNIASKVGKVADAIDPVSGTLKLGGKTITGAGLLGKNFLGATTGVGTEAISQAFKSGKKGGEAQTKFIENIRGKVQPENVVQDAVNVLKGMGDTRLAKYSKNKNLLKLDEIKIDFNKVLDEINKFEKEITYQGVTELGEEATKKLAKIRKHISDWQSNPSLHNAKGMDVLKRKIDSEFPGLGASRDAGMVVTKIRNIVKNQIVKQAPDYAKVMNAYEDAIKLEQKLMKELSMGNKASASATLKKLQSAMRDEVNTNFGSRLDAIKTLESVDDVLLLPQLAGQSLRSIFPRGIGRALAGGGGALTIGGLIDPITLVTSLTASSPRIVGEAVNKAGMISRPFSALANANSKLPSLLQAGNITKLPRATGLLQSSIEESQNKGLLQ